MIRFVLLIDSVMREFMGLLCMNYTYLYIKTSLRTLEYLLPFNLWSPGSYNVSRMHRIKRLHSLCAITTGQLEVMVISALNSEWLRKCFCKIKHFLYYCISIILYEA